MPDPLLSACGEPFDPRPAIEAWRAGDDKDAPQELWENLFHQGRVGSASYAAVSELVRMMKEQTASDWRAYSLIASIEEGRLAEENPPLPADLEQDYSDAWTDLLPLALRDLLTARDDLLVRGALAVVAYAKGQRSLAAITLCTEDERVKMLSM